MTSIKTILEVGRPWASGLRKLTDSQRQARDDAHKTRQARQASRDAKASIEQTVVFNDGVFGVTIGRHIVLIAKQDAHAIHVPRGHAYFDRVCEANDRRSVEDLYNELASAIA